MLIDREHPINGKMIVTPNGTYTVQEKRSCVYNDDPALFDREN